VCDDYFDIYALLKSFGFHIRDKTKKRKKSILCRVTTGLPGKDLCRVLNPWHTAKVPFFAVCCGLWHTAKLPCLPCVKTLGTRQSACATISCRHRLFFAECRVMHTAKALPCARQKTHGKEGLCRRLVAVGLLSCATHGKSLPYANRALLCVYGTRQIACVPQ